MDDGQWRNSRYQFAPRFDLLQHILRNASDDSMVITVVSEVAQHISSVAKEFLSEELAFRKPDGHLNEFELDGLLDNIASKNKE